MSCCTDTKVAVYRKRNRTIRITLTGPGDLTGAKIWFSVKDEKSDPDNDALILKKNLAAGGTDDQAKVIDGPNGIIEIYIVPTDTVSMSAGDYLYDVVIETAAGRKLEAIEPSTFRLIDPVTVT